jgi:PIN domain nuclease of toxin-antitoxin system
MNILLDTHILLWYLTDNPKLSDTHARLIDSAAHKKYVSIASLWEIAIKVSMGKLEINQPIETLVPHGITILGISIEHIKRVLTLPFHHKDPFDRMIISQAMAENFKLMSVDGNFPYYDVEIV